jgi:hypothetical protein
MKNLRSTIAIIYPFIFAIFPVISNFLINKNKILVQDLFSVIGLFLLMAIILLTGFGFILKSKVKAGILTSIIFYVLFSFHDIVYLVEIIAKNIGYSRQAHLLMYSQNVLWIWLIIDIIVIFLFSERIVSEKWPIYQINQFLSIFSIGLVLITLFNVIAQFKKYPPKTTQSDSSFNTNWGTSIANEPCLLTKPAQQPPDIYYIILDSYARNDVLLQMYDTDNKEFISFLQENGFIVATNAKANYKHTSIALSSYLNFDYLDRLEAETGLDALNENHLSTLIENNRTFHQLRCIGYEIIAYSSGFYYTDIRTADEQIFTWSLDNSFLDLMISSSPISIVMQNYQYNQHRNRILFTLKDLQDVPQTNKPKFIFAHIFSPHPPFVLGRNGKPINPQRFFSLNDGSTFMKMDSKDVYISGYADQVVGLNLEIKKTISGILINSKIPPIIIIQGDHGPASEYSNDSLVDTNLWERMSIFSAYYLQGERPTSLYSDITPVNTFRIVFNEYFGSKLPLLEDISYYSPDSNIKDMTDVTNLIKDNMLP